MKKIIFIISLFLLLPLLCIAEGLNISYKEVDGKYELIFKEDDKVLNYDEVNKKYNIGHYFEFLIDGKDYYFLDGKEIDQERYESGKKIEEKKSVCNNELTFCIDITNQDELLNKIDEIYTAREIGEYHLIYNDEVYKKLNFSEINSTYKSKYMMDLKQNAYKYSEYGIIQPIKKLPYHDENELIISTLTYKTTEVEERLVEKFLESFLSEFEGKTDYEKVLGVYNYISNTAKYESDDGYKLFVDGRISPYDVLLTHKTVCIGSSTTFQFLMEKLGVESYIIDHVSDYNEDTYSTTHTYNAVRLDDKWYIVDINSPESSSTLLSSITDKYDSKDFEYLGITISDKSYYELNPNASKSFDIDYDKYVKLADDLVNDKGEEKEEIIENIKKNFKKEYIYIIGILFAVCVIIIYFTKKA